MSNDQTIIHKRLNKITGSWLGNGRYLQNKEGLIMLSGFQPCSYLGKWCNSETEERNKSSWKGLK